ncbi:head-tail connector protein [Nocardia sp. NPDC057440]|uniref:head-tail connector protein n=1 Tax=Nocardia sp. NPDC057440 TaxID=3346134 RepID=UPI003672A903
MGDPYVTRAQLKQHLGIKDSDASKDDLLDIALDSASREIENHCERQFNQVGTASARVYPVIGRDLVLVDDIYTMDGFEIRIGEVGSGFGSALSSDLFEVRPINGVVNGVPGWAFSRIKLSCYAPYTYSTSRVEVTAKWGWQAVPAPVKEACLLIAAKNWKLQDAPLGVAGFKDFGTAKVENDPIAVTKLCPYTLGRGKR